MIHIFTASPVPPFFHQSQAYIKADSLSSLSTVLLSFALCMLIKERMSKERSQFSASATGSKRRALMVEREEVKVAEKRVMVVVDHTAGAKHAMVWALTHVANRGDLLTLLHVLPINHQHCSGSSAVVVAQRREKEKTHTHYLAHSLAALCRSIRPEVRVEALEVQGPKLATVLGQVKKLEASVLVLSQSKPSPLCCMFKTSNQHLVEQCVERSECLTMAVRKRISGVGGYLVSTRWQKNFWLLA